MPQSLLDEEIILDVLSAGLLMSPEEFDNITEYDDRFRYELIHGVVVVSPIPLADESSPNELLGNLLFRYQEDHPQGKALDESLAQQYVRTSSGRRIADRLIWTGLGRPPNVKKDVPSIAVEFVSGSKRDRQRDYVDKRDEYHQAGIGEYWIIDRFRRTLTIILHGPDGMQELMIKEGETYESARLPGFQVPLRGCCGADQHAQHE